QTASRRRRGRSARRHLHDLPRPAAAPGLQQRAAQRRDHSVRQLPADPVLRRRCTRDRRRGAATRTVIPDPGAVNPDRPLIAYIDGGARGNPGPAGFGVRIEQPDGTLVDELSESIGTATNNVAEYRGLLAALEWARAQGHRTLHVRSDSLLLVQQMRGNYKVKNAGLQ